MSDGYKAKLKDGRAIYIPNWPVTVALENVAKAGKVLGSDNIITIAGLNKPMAIVALMEADDSEEAASLMKHFVCQARIAGDKIEPETVDDLFEGDLHTVLELFTHVMHSQFHEFFSLGLAKASSPGK